MRLMFGLFLGAGVLALAFWAYQENYKTRQAFADVREMQREIGSLNERLGVLRAEWAFLNRPDRLRELVELNYKALHLMPMAPDHFGRLDQVSYPPKPEPVLPEPDPLEMPIVAAADGESFP